VYIISLSASKELIVDRWVEVVSGKRGCQILLLWRKHPWVKVWLSISQFWSNETSSNFTQTALYITITLQL